VKFDRRDPCPKCPFRKDSAPGWLGGHSPRDLLDVVLRDGAWPCHQTHEGMSFEAARKHPTVQHCGGAAAFASNICKVSRDTEVAAHQRVVGRRADVFGLPQGFLAHHRLDD
jgi:hypothetical protein